MTWDYFVAFLLGVCFGAFNMGFFGTLITEILKRRRK